jgi:hypothetical protein
LTLFQTIKSRGKLHFFYDGGFHDVPPKGGATYDFHPSLDTTFAELLCEGSPDRFINVSHFEDTKNTLKLHLTVLKKAKVNLVLNDWYNLVPRAVLTNYLETKNEMTSRLVQLIPETESYRILKGLGSLLHEIGQRKAYEEQAVKYSMLKSKTGRLTTAKGSFPILTMKKEERSILKPKAGIFLSLDFNAFDVRVLMALCGHAQPLGDPHQWHCDEVFKIDDRAEAKRRYFAWLFNPQASDPILEEIYDRHRLLDRYYKDGVVTTPYGKKIEADDFHALSYLVQSSAASLFFEQVLKVRETLKGHPSAIVFLLHDEVIIDLSGLDKDWVSTLGTIYSDTRFGVFPVRTKVGRNLGEMKKVKRGQG